LKDEEIYNIIRYDYPAEKPSVRFDHLHLRCGRHSHVAKPQCLYRRKYRKKRQPGLKLKEWVDNQYANGRVTTIGKEELWEASKNLGIL
jgi:hypothetical protein